MTRNPFLLWFVDGVTNENEGVFFLIEPYLFIIGTISLSEPKTFMATTNNLDSSNEDLIFNFLQTLGEIIGYTWKCTCHCIFASKWSLD
jgi:hypothetical protein